MIAMCKSIAVRVAIDMLPITVLADLDSYFGPQCQMVLVSSLYFHSIFIENFH